MKSCRASNQASAGRVMKPHTIVARCSRTVLEMKVHCGSADRPGCVCGVSWGMPGSWRKSLKKNTTKRNTTALNSCEYVWWMWYVCALMRVFGFRWSLVWELISFSRFNSFCLNNFYCQSCVCFDLSGSGWNGAVIDNPYRIHVYVLEESAFISGASDHIVQQVIASGSLESLMC